MPPLPPPPLSAEDGTNVSFPLNYKYGAAFLNV